MIILFYNKKHMKKLFTFLILLTGVIVTSCEKQELEPTRVKIENDRIEKPKIKYYEKD